MGLRPIFLKESLTSACVLKNLEHYPGNELWQGTYCVHCSLIFIVYTILFTICTLLKLYTIGYIAGSGGKKPRILVQNEPAQLHNQDGRRPAPNPEDVRGTRLAIKSKLNKKKLLFIAQNQWLVLYIKCWSHERLWSRLLSSS